MANSTPNLVKISEIAAELWRFSFFQDGGWPPSWILLQVKNGVTAGCRLSMQQTVYVYHHAKFCDSISNGSRVIAIFLFFKMAAGRRLGLAQLTYRTTHDGSLAVLSVLSNFVLI